MEEKSKDLTPNIILNKIVDNRYDDMIKYTFIICGKPGPTGKSWLWNKLKKFGLNAIEISERVVGYVNYRDDENHYIVDDMNKSIIIVLNQPLRLVKKSTLTLDRAKRLLLNMIESHGKPFLGGEWLDISDTINYLFTLDFTEEEILELGFCTEEDIDRANEENMSNI